MKIVVCVKHVPDVESDRRLEDGVLVRGEDDVLNELDENAVEAAVSTVEEFGGEVVALSMGPEDAEDAISRALQLGADSGVRITDDELAGSDALATAEVLAKAIQKIGQDGKVDLIITGMASLDGMTSMLPGSLATQLGLPSLTLAQELQVTEKTVRIRKVADGFVDELEADLPAVVSVTDQVNEPRFPNFADMAAARKKPVTVWQVSDLGLQGDDRTGIEGAGTNVLRARQAPAKTAGKVVADAGEGGHQLAQFLINAGFSGEEK